MKFNNLLKFIQIQSYQFKDKFCLNSSLHPKKIFNMFKKNKKVNWFKENKA
jgi:hypothetical protein